VSAIRSFLEVSRIIANTGYSGAKGWLEQIDAADTELKERDRADAELLAAWNRLDTNETFEALEHWAAAKGGC
jgi:hypothetical protein